MEKEKGLTLQDVERADCPDENGPLLSKSKLSGSPIQQRRTCKKRKNSEMSEEEKQQFREKIKFYRVEKKIREELLSDVEREQLKNERYMKRMAYFASIPKEEMAERNRRAREYNRRWWATMPVDRKKRLSQRTIQRIKGLEGEALQKHIESRRKGVRKYHKKLKENDRSGYLKMMQRNIKKRWGKFCEYQREKVRNETEEQREMRLLRYRVYQAKRKAKQEMEAEGTLSRDEIERRLEQVEEEVRSKPKLGSKSEYKPRTAARKPRNKKKEISCDTIHLLQQQQEICANVELVPEITDQPTIIFHPETSDLCLPDPPQATAVEFVMGDSQSEIQIPVPLPPFLEIVVVNADTWAAEEAPQDFLLSSPHPNVFTHSSSEFCQAVCNDHHHVAGELVEIQSPFTTEGQDPIPEKTYLLMDTTQIKSPHLPSNLLLLSSPPQQQIDLEQNQELQPIIQIPLKNYICEECGHLFCTPRGVRDHKHKKHNPVGSNLTCPECKFICPSPAALWAHFSLYHAAVQEGSSPQKEIDPIERTTPNIPRRQRSQPGTIKNGRYYRGTEEPNGNECPECQKKFHQKSTLDDHIRRVHQGKGRHPCPICSYDMQSPVKLWRHQVQRHGMRDLPPPKGVPVIICEYCSEVILRGYPQHIQKKHPEHYKVENKVVVVTGSEGEDVDFRMKCPHCPSLLINDTVLTKHLKFKHSDKQQQQHKCLECGKLFHYKYLLSKHLSQQHLFSDLERKLEAKQLIRFTSPNKKSFDAVCLLCNVHLPERISIKAHFVSDHHEILKGSQADGGVARLQIHQCKFCPQNFASGGQLDNHLRKSHPHQIFKCGGDGAVDCDVIKMTRRELEVHQKCHKKSGGYQENDIRKAKKGCSTNYWRGGPEVKQFIKNSLRTLRVHCPECAMAMEYQSLSSHLKRFHQKKVPPVDEVLECPACERQFSNQMYQLAHSHLIHKVPLDQLVKLAVGEERESENQEEETSLVTSRKKKG